MRALDARTNGQIPAGVQLPILAPTLTLTLTLTLTPSPTLALTLTADPHPDPTPHQVPTSPTCCTRGASIR